MHIHNVEVGGGWQEWGRGWGVVNKYPVLERTCNAHNRHPQARLSIFDDTWHIISDFETNTSWELAEI